MNRSNSFSSRTGFLPVMAVLACLVVLAALAPWSVAARTADWKLVWADEFDVEGLPDATKWNYEEGFVRNAELQYYTKARRENARVEGGSLILEARKERWKNAEYSPGRIHGKDSWRDYARAREYADYTSASLTTRGRQDWTYGRIEARVRLPRGRGMWPAVWMLGSNIDRVGWPSCGEIDIMESVGFEPDVNHGSVHTKAYNHIQRTQRTATIAVPRASEEFHRYSIEWTPERIDFLVDGKRYLAFENEHKGVDAWPYDAPQYLILNVAVGGMWGAMKGVDPDIFPQRMLVDYVRVYRQE